MSQSARPMNAAEWTMLLALSVLWGGTFFFQGVAVRALPAFTIVLLRVVIAALVLHVVLRAIGLRFPLRRDVLIAFAGMGLLNNVLPFCLIVWGQQHMPREIASGLASILNATTPLFGVVVAHLLTADEKATRLKAAGVLIGFVGVVAMVGGEFLNGLSATVLAPLSCLAAALVYAFAGIYGRRFKAMGIAPMVAATGQVTASSVILLPIALLVDQPWLLPMPGMSVWLAILGLATVSTALAYILYFRLLSTAGATNLLLVTFLIPVTAILLGTLSLGETLQPKHFVGMLLIGCGLACIDGRLPRLLLRDRQAATG